MVVRVTHDNYGLGTGKIYKNADTIQVDFDCGITIPFGYNFAFTKNILKLANPNDNLPIPLKPLPKSTPIINKPRVFTTPKKPTPKHPIIHTPIPTTTPAPSAPIKPIIFTPDLSDILKRYIADFNQKQHFDFVVKDSIPIVWFGDIDAYFNSKFKIVTIGLNPSVQEFMYKDAFNNMLPLPDNEKRFDIIDFVKTTDDEQVEKLKTTLNNYFKKNPYKWFDKYEKLLNIKNCSYYTGAKDNTAIHIDLFSAIATNPTWGKLNEKQKSQIENKELFMKLLEVLNPDFVLCSVNNKTFEDVFKKYKEEKVHKFDGNNYIRVYKENGSNTLILNGTNMQGIPFGGIKEERSKIVIACPFADCENCWYYKNKTCGGNIYLCPDYKPF